MNKLSILGIFVADLAFFGKIPKVGETILGQDFVVGPGGKGSNQSVAAGKAGASINFITKVGDDDYGKMAFRIYKETNVGSDYVYVSKEHNTGVAAILLNKDTGENAIGFIAQEVESLVGEVITKPTEEGAYETGYMMNYSALTAVLTKAIQEQQVIIDDLKSRIETLEG